MNNKEIMESVKLNEKGKRTALILVIAASIVAAVVAVVGFLGGKKSRQSGLKKSDRVNAKKRAKARAHSAKKASAPKEKSVETVAQKPAAAPQKVYVVRPLPEKKQESKAKRFRRHMCAAVASILVVSLVGSGTMSLVQPSTALAAKGSFSGIDRVVSEHNDEPYVILNIVPTSAKYTSGNSSIELSTGTLGYFVNGQAPIVEDLKKLRENDNFRDYSKRAGLIDGLNSPNASFPNITYKEAYGNIDNVGSGWTLMYDADERNIGLITARVKKRPNSAEGYLAGYDFDCISANWSTNSLPSGGYFELSSDGTSLVKFEPSADGNYVMQDAINLRDLANATSTWVYKYNAETNTYEWQNCTIWDLIADKISVGPSDANGSGHEHVFSIGWWWDGNNHWRICTADGCSITNENANQYAELNGFAGHDYVWERVDDDNHERVCSVCGFRTETIMGHSWIEADGVYSCTDCGVKLDADPGTGNEPETDPVPEPIPDPDTDDDDTDDNETDDDETNDDDTDDDDTDDDETDDDETDDEAESYTDARNTPVSNGWVKLVEVEPTDWSGEESDSDSSESPVFDWSSVDDSVWEWLESEGYRVVTFRALGPDESPEGPLYDCTELGDAGNIYDAYNFVPAEEDEEDEYGISTLSLLPELEDTTTQYKFKYKGPGEGEYRIERVANGTPAVDGEIAIIKVENVSVYYQCTTNCDWLREWVFNTDNSDFRIQVKTVLASEVDIDDVNGADLIYIEDYNNTILTGNSIQYTSFMGDDGNSDMSEAVVSQILYRVVEELVPVIVDYEVATGGDAVDPSITEGYYEDSNYSLLAQALLKENLVDFCEAMNGKDDGNLVANIRANIDNTDFPDKVGNDHNFVNRNVYVVSGEPLVSAVFRDEISDIGFSEVLTAIKAENTMLSDEDKLDEKVTPAMAVQYIINFSVGMVGEFSDLTILELQPTANTLSDLTTYTNKGYTKLCWKTEAMTTAKQILSSKTEFNVYKDIKSVAEFNGEWEDINGNYDIVFIGLDGQRLNRETNDERTSLYNNSSLNGQVYHAGDDSGVGSRYDANDITAQKMTDLLNYMRAGYPILVENNFFTNESAQKAGVSEINTRYVGSDTTMYRFLEAAITEYKDWIFTVSDAMSSPMFMTQVRMAKPRISLVSENGEEISAKIKSLTADENGDYRGTLTYRITDNKGGDYPNYDGTVIHLYADYNYDGNFAPEEEVGEYTNYGGTIEVVASDMGPGILPWKLEVTDAGNAYRRDSVQGYFVLGASSVGDLKVLQITEKLNDDRVNLKTMFNTKEDSLLGYYLRSAELYTNTEFIFETLNVSQLETELGKNPKYLEQWDVVVMTLDGGAESQAVTDAVTGYANNGRSLLVCAQGQDGEYNSGGSRLGLSAALLGQSENNNYIFTYTALGISSATQYLRYNGLSRDMIAGSYNLKAETVNDGSISYYPYQLGSGSIAVADGTLLRAPTYLLDFENNLSSESNATYVTAWYTFASDGESSEYGVSPRDARNNYYCYSRGNVVYLAQSEYPYTYNSQDMTTTDGAGSGESQLFVNALMAAYSAGVHNANVHIVAGFAPDSADVESIPVPFDQDWVYEVAADGTVSQLSSNGMLDNNVDVYFRFRDSNMAKNKTVQIEFLREEPLGADFLGIGVNMIPFASQIWAVKDGRLTLVEPDQLVSGQTYRIQAPVVTMDNNSDKNKADIYVVIRTTFMRGGKECTVTSYDKVSLNRAELRPLE